MRSFALLVLLGAAGVSTLSAQALNPPYLSEMPSVERVKKDMVVSDPRETALRQIGAFYQLMTVINFLSGRREFRGLLPDEARIAQEYNVAQYYIGKAIDSAYPGPYKTMQKVSDYTPYRYDRSDPAFGVEGLNLYKRYFSPAFMTLVDAAIGADKAMLARRAAAQQEELRASQAAQAAAAAAPSANGMHNDAGTVKARQCVEAGRNAITCMTEGIGEGFKELMGGVGLDLGLGSKKAVGLLLNGDFPGTGFRASFSVMGGNVTLSCGRLMADPYPYTIELQPSQLVLRIETSPAPLTLYLRPDGRLVGTGTATVNGRIQTGTRYWTRIYDDGRQVPMSEPVYGPATDRCTPGTLTATPAAPPTKGTADAATKLVEGMGALFGIEGPLPNGLRIDGTYGSPAGMHIEFHPTGAVVGCGDVGVMHPYTVSQTGSRVQIAIEASKPILLTYQSAEMLVGSGQVQVNGRKVVGTTPNGEIAYAPKTLTCSLGNLSAAP